MERLKVSPVEYGVSKSMIPGQVESGDLHLVHCNGKSILIAVVDGLGHGEQAANAARTAISVLKEETQEPIISLVDLCHEKLQRTRGVVLSLASIDTEQRMMTWLGIGNVQGVLIRRSAKDRPAQESLLLRGGVVGAQLPSLQATVLPVGYGDTLYFATDGVRSEFSADLVAMENPQRAADRILEKFHNKVDDALVLVARLTGIRQ